MNYLAHIHLAAHSEQAMVGAFLGDFLRPHEAAHLGPEVVREILVHRHVDTFTDGHPEVRAIRRLCRPPYRLFARVSLDVLFDHLLAQDWSRYSDQSFDRVVGRFYEAIASLRGALPDRLVPVIDRMLGHDWLRSYAQPEAVDAAVARLAARLSRKGEYLIASLAELRAHEATIEVGFRRFYPELIRSAGERRQLLLDR